MHEVRNRLDIRDSHGWIGRWFQPHQPGLLGQGPFDVLHVPAVHHFELQSHIEFLNAEEAVRAAVAVAAAEHLIASPQQLRDLSNRRQTTAETVGYIAPNRNMNKN